jgi:type IV secretion system protein VirB4
MKGGKRWTTTFSFVASSIVGFATQSAQDALESRIASAIIEQAATQIFMINPKARATDYIEGFGLTPHEFELVRTLPDNSHCFLIKHGNESVIARLNLTNEKSLLTILSGREETVRILDEILERTGTDPHAWMIQLLERA